MLSHITALLALALGLAVANPPQRDLFHPKIPIGSTLIYDSEWLEVS